MNMATGGSESKWGNLLLPDKLPAPRCRVMLICGPPGAGKSTYVQKHMRPGNAVIDIDLIARDLGLGRWRPIEATARLLSERNDRLAALAEASPTAVAWVIVGAPGKRLRAWWCERLGVADGDMILLIPTRAELMNRIQADPSRRSVAKLTINQIDQWFEREREDEVLHVARDCDTSGWPVDVWAAGRLI